MNEPPSIGKRISRIRKKLGELRLESILFFDMLNIRYLVGFTGSDGALLVGENKAVLLVDGRYITQARGESEGCEIFEYRDKTDALVSLISDGGMKNVGFESSSLTCDKYFELTEKLPHVTFSPLSRDLTSLRTIKDATEREYMRRAAEIASEAFISTLDEIAPGVYEKDISQILEAKMRERGGDKPSFNTIVASGRNSALPHAQPGWRKCEEGDFIVIDFGTTYRGYHSDETCTVAVGNLTTEQRKVYGVVKDAHDRVVDAVRSGVSCRELDAIARQWIERAGLGSYFSHGTGHGVGLDIHEAPTVSMRSDEYLEAGMVVTIEPGVYVPDKWGVRIEDMVFVERDGCEVLSRVKKELQIL